MPVIRIDEDDKQKIDEYVEDNFSTEVSYRVAIAEIMEDI